MGVTIHYEGKLRGREQLQACVAAAEAFARAQGWLQEAIDREEVTLARHFDDEWFEYHGPTRGVRIYPHDDCDPISLEFDRNLFLQDFTKTQYAGAEIHIKVVELLRAVEPCFVSLEVFDEGEYWESTNRQTLERHLADFWPALESAMARSPGAKVKVKLESGKIADMIVDRRLEKKRRWWQLWKRELPN